MTCLAKDFRPALKYVLGAGLPTTAITQPCKRLQDAALAFAQRGLLGTDSQRCTQPMQPAAGQTEQFEYHYS